MIHYIPTSKTTIQNINKNCKPQRLSSRVSALGNASISNKPKFKFSDQPMIKFQVSLQLIPPIFSLLLSLYFSYTSLFLHICLPLSQISPFPSHLPFLSASPILSALPELACSLSRKHRKLSRDWPPLRRYSPAEGQFGSWMSEGEKGRVQSNPVHCSDLIYLTFGQANRDFF